MKLKVCSLTSSKGDREKRVVCNVRLGSRSTSSNVPDVVVSSLEDLLTSRVRIDLLSTCI